LSARQVRAAASEPAAVQRAHRDPEAGVLLADEPVCRHVRAVEDDLRDR
jgi:hypothetical protein